MIKDSITEKVIDLIKEEGLELTFVSSQYVDEEEYYIDDTYHYEYSVNITLKDVYSVCLSVCLSVCERSIDEETETYIKKVDVNYDGCCKRTEMLLKKLLNNM